MVRKIALRLQSQNEVKPKVCKKLKKLKDHQMKYLEELMTGKWNCFLSLKQIKGLFWLKFDPEDISLSAFIKHWIFEDHI